MSGPTREARLLSAFVALADTLVADFDLVDVLQMLVETCTDVLDADAGGLLLKNDAGELHVMVSTEEDANLVEVVQLGAASGPCWECASTGEPVTVADIGATGDRWPEFRRAALDHGFRAVHVTPMRLRDDVIGAMGLFSTTTGALGEADIATAQALSDVATIGVLADRATQQRDLVSTQLRSALESRIVIEQAKGVLAQSAGVSMNDAFTALRTFARTNGLGLRAVTTAVVERRLGPAVVLAPRTER